MTETPRPFVIIFQSQRLFGVNFYPSRCCFDATVTRSGDGALVQPVSQGIEVPAEWWRRLGWHVAAKPYQRVVSFLKR